MPFDQSVIHRKIFIPWYDSSVACLITICFMACVLCFGIFGLMVAFENPSYLDHIWVPGLLILLSTTAILSMLIRLAKRYIVGYKP